MAMTVAVGVAEVEDVAAAGAGMATEMVVVAVEDVEGEAAVMIAATAGHHPVVVGLAPTIALTIMPPRTLAAAVACLLRRPGLLPGALQGACPRPRCQCLCHVPLPLGLPHPHTPHQGNHMAVHQDLEVLPPQATADRLLEAAPLQDMFRIVVLHMGPQCRAHLLDMVLRVRAVLLRA